MPKPLGIGIRIEGDALTFGVTHATKAEDLIYDAVEQAMAEGLTPTQFTQRLRDDLYVPKRAGRLSSHARVADVHFRRRWARRVRSARVHIKSIAREAWASTHTANARVDDNEWKRL